MMIYLGSGSVADEYRLNFHQENNKIYISGFFNAIYDISSKNFISCRKHNIATIHKAKNIKTKSCLRDICECLRNNILNSLLLEI